VVGRRGNVLFDLNPDLGWYVARVRIEGRDLGAKATLVAQIGSHKAECKVQVVQRDDGIPDLRIEFSNEDPGSFRAYFDPPDPGPDGSQKLKVLIRHPAFQPILGAEMQYEQTPEWRTALAEVVTDAMVRRLVTRRYPISQEIDSQTLYRDHVEWISRLLPKIQRVLLQGRHGPSAVRAPRPGARPRVASSAGDQQAFGF
jgi:hypothetical protein